MNDEEGKGSGRMHPRLCRRPTPQSEPFPRHLPLSIMHDGKERQPKVGELAGTPLPCKGKTDV